MRIAVVALALVLLAIPAFARRGGGRHSRSSGPRSYRSFSTHSYRPRSSASSYRSHSYSTHSYRSRSSYTRRSYGSRSYRARTVPTYRGVRRDSHGRIKRSAAAKDAFKRQHPCPSNGKRSGACPGYVIDHIKPLANGGADHPSNMQWQTKADAKAKDKWEQKR